MDTSRQRFIRLAIVTATAAGVALASPVVAVADESEVIEASPIGEASGLPVVIAPTTEPLVIELVIDGEPPTDSTESARSDESEDGDTTVMAGDQAGPEAMPTVTNSEPGGADLSPVVVTLETDGDENHTDEHSDEPDENHSGGPDENHSGGSGENHSGGPGEEHSGASGTGDPYRITFEVSWRLPDDSIITTLDDELPTDWRTLFDLAAASATGGSKPKLTSAHCTYPDGSTDLVCEFQNPGKHSSVTDGLIVPGKKSAPYSVTVLWPTSGWAIEGANAGPYFARDLDMCPRGEGGHDGGHDSGHDETIEVAALEDTGSTCLHTVVIRQVPRPPEPPPVEPPPVEPPPVEPPPVQPPPVQDPPASEVSPVEPAPSPAPPEATPTTPAVEVLPVTVTPRALPATGNTATTTLMIGTVILAMGGCLLMLTRRRNDLPLT